MFLCFLCALSSSLDSLTVSISYGAKKVRLPLSAMLVVSFVSTLGTFLSMRFGQILISFAGEDIIKYIGSFILIFIGAFFVYDSKTIDELSIGELIDNPSKLDYDNSGHIDVNEALFLASALTINNLGVGIASSIAGLNIYATTLFTFVITFALIKLGYYLGRKYLKNLFGKHAQVISGLIIIIIGLVEII